ncbi:MAG: hypothetical protein WC789_00805 [Lentisphaeria bacterium]|jgi:hypothetical protein
MTIARQGKELVVEVVNDIGVLQEVAKTVSDKGINILAVHGEANGNKAVFRLVTDDNLRAGDALKARKYAVHEADAVLVEIPNKPGMLRQIVGKLAASGIDIRHIGGSALVAADRCLIVLDCSNNGHAVVVLNE